MGRPDSNSDRTRDADADAPQPAGDVLGRAQQRAEQRIDALEAAFRSVLDAGGFVVVTQDPAIEAGDGDVDARRPEIGDRTCPASAQKASWRGGRPPVLGPTSPSITSPRSISS